MVLEDHRRDGKKFIPPFADQVTEVFYVEHLLPELIWMAYILEEFGDRNGVSLITAAVRAAYESKDWQKKPEFTLLSTYASLKEEDCADLVRAWRKAGVIGDLRKGLRSFLRAFPESPLAFVADKHARRSPTRTDLDRTRSLIADTFDRWTFRAVVLQSLVPVCDLLVGKLSLASHLKIPDFNVLFRDPESEEGHRVAGFIRCIVSQVVQVHRGELQGDWCEYFWNRGLELQEPMLDFAVVSYDHARLLSPIEKFATRYRTIALSHYLRRGA